MGTGPSRDAALFHVQHSCTRRSLLRNTLARLFHVEHGVWSRSGHHAVPAWTSPQRRTPDAAGERRRTLAHRLEHGDLGTPDRSPAQCSTMETDVWPSLMAVVRRIDRRFGDQQPSAGHDEPTAQLGSFWRRPESPGERSIETPPVAGVTGEHRRVTIDHLHPVGEPETTDGTNEEVGTAGTPIEQRQLQPRETTGDDQTRQTTAGADIDASSGRLRQLGEQGSDSFDRQLDRCCAQKAETLGIAQRLEQLSVHGRTLAISPRSRGRSRPGGTDLHPRSGSTRHRFRQPCRGSPCGRPRASARGPAPDRCSGPLPPVVR